MSHVLVVVLELTVGSKLERFEYALQHGTTMQECIRIAGPIAREVSLTYGTLVIASCSWRGVPTS